MPWVKILFCSFLAMTLFMGCALETDSILKSPLHNIHNQFTPYVIWNSLVGYGSSKYYSQLSPAYDNSVVYAANRNGTVKAIDINSGDTLWAINLSQNGELFKAHVPALLSSGLTVSGDQIYIGTETGKVIGLNKANGQIKWQTEVAGEALAQPVVSHGLVLIHTSNDILQALDAQTGNIKWSISFDSSGFSIRGKSAPATVYGLAIVGNDVGRISAVLLDKGNIVWQQDIANIIGSSAIDRLHNVNMTPVIDINSGTIFAVAYNGYLVAINLRSSQILWLRNIGAVNNIILSNDNTTIYLVDQHDCIWAIRTTNGVTLWRQDALLHRYLTAPAIYDGYLIVADVDGYLHWLDIHDGTFVSQHKVDSSGFLSRLVIANNKLLIQAQNSMVYLIQR